MSQKVSAVRGAACVVLLVVVLATRGARAEDPPPDPAPALPASFATRVNQAIDKGVAWLRLRQKEDGSFPIGKAALDVSVPGLGGDISSQWAGGPWEKGADALAVYTLAACDVPRTDPVLVLGFKRIRAHWDGRRKDVDAPLGKADGVSTYFVSLCLLALDAACERAAEPLHPTPEQRKARGRVPLAPADRAWALELVEWLRLAQDPGGEDDHGALPDPPPTKRRPPKRSKPAKSDPDEATSGETGGFGYESPAMGGGYHDHSNTQYAALGLKAAARLGVPVPQIVWTRLLRHLLAAQEEDGPEVARVEVPGAPTPQVTPSEGKTVAPSKVKDRARGWSYACPRDRVDAAGGAGGQKEAPTLSMTAAGVSTLVIARSELLGAKSFSPELRTRTEAAIRDGFAWVATHLPVPQDVAAPGAPSVPKMPPGLEGLASDELDDFYFLYGLERACILAGVRSLAGIDWYRVGADRILDRQQQDGSFLSKSMDNANGRPLIDSTFALLFLKRALLRVPDRAVVTESDEAPAPPDAPKPAR